MISHANKFETLITLGTGAILLGLAACASSAPTQQLVDARRAFHDAELSSAAKTAPQDVLTARQALDAAERAHDDDPGSRREAHLAYIAERNAQIAMARGDTALALQSERNAEARHEANLEQNARSGQSKLQQTQAQLQQAQETQRYAEARAAAAMASLRDVAKVREEERGTVVTLSGSVLFTSGGDTLSEVARQSLDRVAAALQEQSKDSRILIEGYTARCSRPSAAARRTRSPATTRPTGAPTIAASKS